MCVNFTNNHEEAERYYYTVYCDQVAPGDDALLFLGLTVKIKPGDIQISLLIWAIRSAASMMC